MRKTILSITSIFMILTLLINTVGITVYPHFCMEEGEVSLNFSKKENCCEEKHHEVKVEKKHACCQKEKSSKDTFQTEKDNCCTQESFTAQWHLNEFSFEKHFEIIVPVISLNNFFHLILPSVENLSSYRKTDCPPLFYSGREILTLHQTFLI